MTQTEQNSTVRTRDEQVGAIANDWIAEGMGRDIAYERSDQMILEAEARGAAEQRRKDREGQEPVAWQKRHIDGTWVWTTCHVFHEENGTATRPLYDRPANVAALEARVKVLEAALKTADQFITNGIEFGFIRMPDSDTPDSALATPGIIRAALTREGGV